MSCSFTSSGMMLCLRAAVDRADGDDGGIQRIVLARHDRLQREDGAGRDDDGIDGRVRRRAVAAAAVDRDVDGVRVGEREARDARRSVPRGATRCRGARSRRPASGTASSRPSLIIAWAPRAALLGRLADQHERSAPARLRPGEQRRRADAATSCAMSCPQACITWTVSPASFFVVTLLAYARPVFSSTGSASMSARTRTVGPVAVLHDRDDAGPPDARRDLVAERAQAVRELRRGLLLVVRELGVLVEIDVELLEVGIERVERSERRIRGGGLRREKRRERTASGSRRRCVSFGLRARILDDNPSPVGETTSAWPRSPPRRSPRRSDPPGFHSPDAVGRHSLLRRGLPVRRLPRGLERLLPLARRLAEGDRPHGPPRDALDAQAAVGAARRPVRRPADLDRRAASW